MDYNKNLHTCQTEEYRAYIAQQVKLKLETNQ